MNIDLKEDGTAAVIADLKKIAGPLGEKASQSALKSCGWYMQQALKDEGRRGSSSRWGRLNPHTKILHQTHSGKYIKTTRWKTGKRKGQVRPKTSRAGKPLSRMVNAPRYVVTGNEVEIGFVGNARSAAGMISSMAVPAGIRVTPKMRRFFFAIGFPLKKETTWLYRRARPWVRPRYEKEKAGIGKRYEDKFIGALERYGVKFE
jgi:hypothetical protein